MLRARIAHFVPLNYLCIQAQVLTLLHNDFDAAVHYLNRRRALTPTDTELLLNLAMAHTMKGATATPTTQVTTSAQAKTVATLSITSLVAASPFWALEAANTGTNAWLKAPSANRRRNKLGIRNATLKASVMALAPNIAAIRDSRTKPVMREARVHTDTVEADLRRLTEAEFSRSRVRRL